MSPVAVSTGKTVAETLGNLREALAMHFQGMIEDGDPIPDPTTLVDYLDVGVVAATAESDA